MSVNFKNLQLVVPGDKLASGNYKAGLGVYREKNKDSYDYYAALIGLVSLQRGNTISIIPLEGSYIPMEDDIIIGIISEVGSRSWQVDLGGPYPGLLSVSHVVDRELGGNSGGGNFHDLSRFLNVGDLILAKVISFDRTRDPVLTMHQRGLKKLVSGRIVTVSPVKIPRIIGRQGSMISFIKNVTKSQIYVGQNGRILINAPDFDTEQLILEIFEKIQKESHIPGLTDRIKELISERLKKN